MEGGMARGMGLIVCMGTEVFRMIRPSTSRGDQGKGEGWREGMSRGGGGLKVHCHKDEYWKSSSETSLPISAPAAVTMIGLISYLVVKPSDWGILSRSIWLHRLDTRRSIFPLGLGDVDISVFHTVITFGSTSDPSQGIVLVKWALINSHKTGTLLMWKIK